MYASRRLAIFALLALITCAVSACAARPAAELTFERQLGAAKGKHILEVMEDSATMDHDHGVLYYLAFDHREQDGTTFKYYFIAFFRCSCGTLYTTDVTITTNRQGFIQDIAFHPVYPEPVAQTKIN
ncbi:MAG: hypothetical protein PWQ57_1870 [Desulfovibrionales bacterium]|nr:hypothetical protein [Desulfovibrionales bacterium]